MRYWTLGVVALTTVFALAPAGAQPAGRYDEATGRNLLNYPPHRFADFIHLKIELSIADMNVPVMEAHETLTLEPIGLPMDVLSLDAKLLTIGSVECAGHTVTFAADSDKLDITFDPPIPIGQRADIAIGYTVNDPPDGLYWTPESPAWPGRAAQLHTQGEPETNSFWFPCHDFPNDQLTTEIVATVPAGFMVCSNGRLVEHALARPELPPGAIPVQDTAFQTGKPMEIWHWLQDKPHVAYLVTLVVGKFDIVDVGSAALPMPVYVPPGRGRDVAGTYGRTPRMAELFSRLVDEPYPWDKYAQVLVWNFLYGGEENTSATTLYDTAVIEPAALADTDLEGLISHELAHQWFGDLITCNSWEHIWLNEGFATYFTPLWLEERDGREGYDAAIRGSFDQVIANDTGAAPEKPGMNSKEYHDPFEVFGRGANPYPKGASILHMLRRRVGDEPFFRAVARYVDEHKFSTAETSDLRKSFEESTGESLERFFHQWCDRPGIPRLDVHLDWKAQPGSTRGELVVTIDQTQVINGDNPAFAFTLPVWVAPKDGKGRTARVEVDARHTEERFALDAPPSMVIVDPDMHVLAELTIHQPGERWVRQLEAGPTLAARIQAARALGKDLEVETDALLEEVARSSGRHDTLRVEAIAALRERGEGSRLLSLVTRGTDDPQVREAAVNALAALGARDADLGAKAAAAFVLMLERDESQLVQAAAVRGIGKVKAVDRLGVVLLAAGRESQDDRTRQGAIDALADLDLPQGLAVAIRAAQPGRLSRTRAAAVPAVARLAHHDPDAAFQAVAALLNDREQRVSGAAGKALVTLGDARGLDELERFAERARGERQKRQTGEWVKELRAKVDGVSSPGP